MNKGSVMITGMIRTLGMLSAGLIVFAGPAPAQAQLVVNGTKVAFRVPDPMKLYPNEMRSLLQYRQMLNLPTQAGSEAVISGSDCVKQAMVVGDIVKNIYVKNNLNTVFLSTTPILFEVLCPTSPYSVLGNPEDSFGHIAFSTSANVVSINALIFRYLKSEDELAYILGHEIAHILFLHGLGQMYLERDLTAKISSGEIPKFRANAIVWKHLEDSEADADKYGMLLSWNAGYSPTVVRRALSFVDSFSLDLQGVQGVGRLRAWLKLRKAIKNDYHGTHAERRDRVEDMFGVEQIREFRKVKPRAGPDFVQAKKEIQALIN